MNFRLSAIRCNLLLFLRKKVFEKVHYSYEGDKESLSKQIQWKIHLELLFQIIGIGSASGLITKTIPY
jgi:hypothetical protein